MQMHRRFTADQVKALLQGYTQVLIERQAVADTLGIGKTRFFALLNEYRRNPDGFSLVYERRSQKRLPRRVERAIEKELRKEKKPLATGRAKERCMALGIGIGSGYLFPTTFKKEVYSDLVGERGVLMGTLAGIMEAQYDVLRRCGQSPRGTFNETVEGLTQWCPRGRLRQHSILLLKRS